MKIRTEFVTNSSSSCFCVTLTLQFDNDKAKTLQFSAYDIEGDGDYFDNCGRGAGGEIGRWNIVQNFAKIAAARNDMEDLFYVLENMLNKSGQNNAYAVWDAEKLTRADMSIHACVEGEYSFMADTYKLLDISQKDREDTYEEELRRLRENNGLVYTDDALETVILYEDADGGMNYKARGKKQGICYGENDISKSVYLHMRQDGKLDVDISYGKKYSPGYKSLNRSTWVIDKEKLEELKRRKRDHEQKRIAERKEELTQGIVECISGTGIRVNAEILKLMQESGKKLFGLGYSEQVVLAKIQELTAYVKESFQQISLEGKILHYPKNSMKMMLLKPVIERLGACLTDEIEADNCDYYVVADNVPEPIMTSYRSIHNAEKVLLSDLVSQILHAEPGRKEVAEKNCEEAKERVSRRLDSIQEDRLSALIDKINNNLNSMLNVPESAETNVTIEAEKDSYSLREAINRGKKIQIRDKIFDIHSRDYNTVPAFLREMKAICPGWSFGSEDYNQLWQLIERAGGAMAQHVRKEQKYADYHIQHEFTKEPEYWYKAEGYPDYGIPAIGLLSLLEALGSAPAVPPLERKSFRELAALKEEIVKAKDEEKERKEKEWREERDRKEIVQFGQVIEELIKLNNERPFRSLAEIENSKAVAQICTGHDFISFNRIKDLIKKMKSVTAGEYLKSIGVLSPENKKRYAEKQKELSDDCYEECIRFIRKRYEGREYLRSFKSFKQNFLDKQGVLEAIMTEICKEKHEFKKTFNWPKLEIERKEIVSNPLTWKGFADYIHGKYLVSVETYMIT